MHYNRKGYGKGEEGMDGKIRLLRADEIECRVASVNEKGVTLLLYKDARVDQRILDETFGIMGWKRSHQCIDGSLYCTVEVYDAAKGEWVSKQDVGTVNLMEKEKSQASDSFKRACFNWGIGRELYSAPFIWVAAAKAGIQRKGEKYCCSGSFHVQGIEYNADREIIGLAIANEKGQPVYVLGASKEKEAGRAEGAGMAEGPGQAEGAEKAGGRPKGRKGGSQQEGSLLSSQQMESLESELQRTGVTMGMVMDRYGIERPAQISEETYRKIMKALEKTKPAA